MKEHSEYFNLWGDRPGYKFEFLKLPAGDKEYELEYWVVLLKQVLSKKDAKKEKLSCNLLTAEICGGGGDSFSREDKVAYLFPQEKAKTQIEQLLSGNYYPISAKRIIKIKSFYVIIQVDSYKLNESNPKKIDSMSITIEVKNWLNK